jgi:hypothetical protein
MTDAQLLRAQAEANQQHARELEAARKGVTLEDEAAIKGSERKIKSVDAAYRPEEKRVGLVGKTEGVKKTREEIRSSRALTPIKVKQGKATLEKTVAGTEKTKVDTRLAPKKVELQGRQVTAAERQAAASEGRLKVSKAQLEESKRRFQISLNKGTTKGEEGRLKERLKNNFKIYGDKRKMASGSESFIHSDADRAQALKDIKRDQKRLDQLQKSSGGSSSVSFKGRADQIPKGVLGRKPAAQASGTKLINGKPYSLKKFLDEGRRRGKDDGALRKKWGEL